MINKLTPTQSFERIPSLDFLRGIAILGILFINIESFAYPNPWSSWQFGFDSQVDYNTRFWVYFLTQGKFYNMFALLFGVGFVIFLERLEQKNIGLKAMDIYARRVLWLFVIGVIHAYFIWDGDVLYHYSICGLLLLPFRSIKSKHLVLVILFLASFSLIKQYEVTTKRQKIEQEYLAALNVHESKRTEKQAKRITTWEKRYSEKSPDHSEVKNPRETYWQGVKKSYEHVSVHKGEFYYKSLLLPSLIIMLIGMMFYRAGIFTDYTVWKYYWLISILVLAIGLTINFFRFYHWTYEDHKPVTNIWQSFLYTFPKESLGLGYILILKMFYEFSIKDANMETSIQILLLDLLHKTKNKCNFTKPKWIDTLQNILNDRWIEKITLDELSVLLDVHPVTISKYFSKFFACTFVEYRRKLKISKSLELIKNSSLSVTEIAYQAGFSDQSHFIRTFKSIVGFTPKAFQKW